MKNRLHDIQKKILGAAKYSNRNPEDIKLIAVSKKQPLEKIKEAIELGITDFGENYVQEFLEKWQSFSGKVNWHFVGHLQTNKVKVLSDKISAIHTLDKFKLFEKLEKEAARLKRNIDCLIQVNIANEDTKSGISSNELPALLKQIPKFSWVKVSGLMCIPPFSKNPEDVRPHFKKLADLKKQMQLEFSHLDLTELSMGMSHDFTIAIEEGATQIRLGEALFGPRSGFL